MVADIETAYTALDGSQSRQDALILAAMPLASSIARLVAGNTKAAYLADDLEAEAYGVLTAEVRAKRPAHAKQFSGWFVRVLIRRLYKLVNDERFSGAAMAESFDADLLATYAGSADDLLEAVFNACTSETDIAIICLRCAGYNDKAIGAALGMAQNTVSKYRKTIALSLGV
jgi:DNA-binding NarL/FixJ family response regulator